MAAAWIFTGPLDFPVQLRRSKHDDAEGPFGGIPLGSVGGDRRMPTSVGMSLDHMNVVGGTGEERDNLNLKLVRGYGHAAIMASNNFLRQETGHVCQTRTRGNGAFA